MNHRRLSSPPYPTDSATIVGAGPIGCATAGYLSRKGLRVTVYDVNSTAIDPIRHSGRVRLQGRIEGEYPVVLATTDPAEALENSPLVLVSVPATAHEELARALAPHFEEGTIVVLHPGQTFSTVAFMKASQEAGLRTDILPVETLGALFAARLIEPGVVNILGIKLAVAYAAYPASLTPACSPIIESLFEPFEQGSSVLEIGLHNMNAVVHPPVVLCNTGLIDSGTPFLFYAQGVTEAVARLVEALDAERLRLTAGLGMEASSFLEWLEKVYGVHHRSVYRAIQATRPYRTIAGPSSLDTRFLLEDVPTGLVPYCSLARSIGVEVPVMTCVVELAGAICGIDFWARGRTLKRLALAGLDTDAIIDRLGPTR